MLGLMFSANVVSNFARSIDDIFTVAKIIELLALCHIDSTVAPPLE